MIDILMNGSAIERVRSYRFRARGGHSMRKNDRYVHEWYRYGSTTGR